MAKYSRTQIALTASSLSFLSASVRGVHLSERKEARREKQGRQLFPFRAFSHACDHFCVSDVSLEGLKKRGLLVVEVELVRPPLVSNQFR